MSLTRQNFHLLVVELILQTLTHVTFDMKFTLENTMIIDRYLLNIKKFNEI